jgi:site-specific DNA-cytosine methylase
VWWDGSNCAGTLTKQNANGAQRMPDKDNFGAVLQPPVVVQPFTKSKRAQSVTDDETWVEGKVNPTLSLFDQGDTRATTVAVAQAMTVRRLTPRECERLQGFPDDYTLIPWRKKAGADCPDGPRYKALGNSMAVNCMAWIGERIAAVENHNAN